MFAKFSELIAKTSTRHRVRAVAFAVLVLSIFGLLAINTGFVDELTWRYILRPEPQPIVVTTTEEVYSLPRAFPTHIRIPKINVDTTFEAPLELNEDGTIGVPDSFDEVGWYKLGAAPGEIGTASVLGHVDSYEGAEVFYLLGQLKPGDTVEIDRDDGTTALFEVERLERYDQEEFPTEEVYGHTNYPSLRLITCSGRYDHNTLKYSHNLVVFARLIEPNQTENIDQTN
jgi:sortase (surface protein transpeptidase)